MKKKEIRLVVTDMDRTLLNDNGNISERNMEAIRKLKKCGIEFAIATGRFKSGLYRVLDNYDIKDYVDYIISLNGVSIYDVRENKTYDFGYLKSEIIAKVYNSLKDFDVSFAVHEGNNMICTKRTKYTDIESELGGYGVVETTDFVNEKGKKYPKLMIIGERNTIEKVEKKLTSDNPTEFNFFRAYDFFIEVVDKSVSKGNALVKLCKLKNIDISKVLAIGDNLNDLDMIVNSGLGVAVGNCHTELRKHAKFISKSNNDDGFAYACDVLIDLKECI